MKLIMAALLALTSSAALASEDGETYLLVIKMGRSADQTERALRVTTTATMAECERLGQAIGNTARDPRSSRHYCHRGNWSPGPYVAGYAAGGYLLERVEQAATVASSK